MSAQPYGPIAELEMSLSYFSGVVVNELFFVLSYPSIKFIDEAVNRGVHVFFNCVGVDRTTIYIDRGFGFMAQLLDGENAAHVGHQVKVALDFFYFRFNISSQGFSDFNMMA